MFPFLFPHVRRVLACFVQPNQKIKYILDFKFKTNHAHFLDSNFCFLYSMSSSNILTRIRWYVLKNFKFVLRENTSVDIQRFIFFYIRNTFHVFWQSWAWLAVVTDCFEHFLYVWADSSLFLADGLARETVKGINE